MRTKKHNEDRGMDRERAFGGRSQGGSRGGPQFDDGHHGAAMANDKRDAPAGGTGGGRLGGRAPGTGRPGRDSMGGPSPAA